MPLTSSSFDSVYTSWPTDSDDYDDVHGHRELSKVLTEYEHRRIFAGDLNKRKVAHLRELQLNRRRIKQ